MQKRNTILMLGILAILVIITAQIIIIRSLWKQQNEMLTLRYRSLTQEAIGTIWGAEPGVHDTIEYLLNDHLEKITDELMQIKDEQKLTEKKKEIFDYVTAVMNKEQDFTAYLSSYFEKEGFEKNFNFRITINNLQIYNATDTLVIYRSEAFTNRWSMGSGRSAPPTEDAKTGIWAYRTRLIRNNYALYFEYFIDFSDKQKLIMKETAASLLMSLFSILLVVIIFQITYKNLMEEKRLSNLKTDFINNMTHELKTPLATITVAGKTLEMQQIRTDESKILDTARLIGKQSVHLNMLINMILEISMWERTEFQLDKKKVKIEEIMKDIVDSFKTGYGNSSTLSQKYNLNGIEADIDVVYFTTMINNLLSNAVKYSDSVPVINIEGSVEDRNICLRVADNGIGISKNDQKHVFDKFYRASSGNIHKYKGLGLGLYYVKKIAAAHGGDVTVNSKPGKGSIFTVTIPY